MNRFRLIDEVSMYIVYIDITRVHCRTNLVCLSFQSDSFKFIQGGNFEHIHFVNQSIMVLISPNMLLR